MTGQRNLVKKLIAGGWLKSEHCINAMLSVDRADFVTDEVPPHFAYAVRPGISTSRSANVTRKLHPAAHAPCTWLTV
jgi:protein-L-isoaspartate O-methyltransferase